MRLMPIYSTDIFSYTNNIFSKLNYIAVKKTSGGQR